MAIETPWGTPTGAASHDDIVGMLSGPTGFLTHTLMLDLRRRAGWGLEDDPDRSLSTLHANAPRAPGRDRVRDLRFDGDTCNAF